MNELLNTPEFRIALTTIAVLILVQLVVRSKKWLDGNKMILRVAIYAALLLSTVLTDWLPDNTIVWNEVWGIWLVTIGTTTISHATLVKWLEGAVPKIKRT